MENAIVGVSARQPSRADDVFSSDGDDDDEDSSTIQSTRVTDYTDEDKKMTDSVSVSQPSRWMIHDFCQVVFICKSVSLLLHT
jgi:hypothetical protein